MFTAKSFRLNGETGREGFLSLSLPLFFCSKEQARALGHMAGTSSAVCLKVYIFMIPLPLNVEQTIDACRQCEIGSCTNKTRAKLINTRNQSSAKIRTINTHCQWLNEMSKKEKLNNIRVKLRTRSQARQRDMKRFYRSSQKKNLIAHMCVHMWIQI